jgi:hypothetical protein
MIQVVDNFLERDAFGELVQAYHECRMYSAYDYGERRGGAYYAVADWIDCYRSDNLRYVFDDISTQINEVLGVRVQLMTFFRHPLETFPALEGRGANIPQHIDRNFERSGVLYMLGTEGQGTTVKDEYVEWAANRAIAFDAQTLHNPHFGGADRISLTFFGTNTKKL